MGIIGFKNQEKLCIYQLVSAILHLGNVQFELANFHHGSDGVFITNKMGNITLQYI
jgi:myosin heavy subunit